AKLAPCRRRLPGSSHRLEHGRRSAALFERLIGQALLTEDSAKQEPCPRRLDSRLVAKPGQGLLCSVAGLVESAQGQQSTGALSGVVPEIDGATMGIDLLLHAVQE